MKKLFTLITIFILSGCYDTTVISKYTEDGGATVRYLKTNKITGDTKYCMLNTYDGVKHNHVCTQ